MPVYRMRSDIALEQGLPEMAGGLFHMRVSRVRGVMPLPCCACGFIGEALCDWKTLAGTCDLWVCHYCTARHTGHDGKRRDLCPRHELEYLAWVAGRTNSTDGDGPGG